MDSTHEKMYAVSFTRSSSTSKRCRYDVFLSYRPKDTLKNFTGHLYTALDQAGIRTFRVYDNTAILMGNDIRLESLKAIRESRVSIIVFSKNYVSSSSCRDELVRILDCKKTDGQLVIPVFYEVNPIDVIEQVRSFGIAFEAANLSEWDMRVISGGYEANFIHIIVEHVLHDVKHMKLFVAKHPVGLNSRVDDLNSLLRIGSGDVRTVGIYGMGGIGKTTIAKALYNLVFHLFEASCFLANVREESERPNGLARLQGQLLSEILKEKNFHVANDHIGISFLEERLQRKRVLIVLDDLDQLDQLERLAGHRHWFGSGSRILITTRNEHLLSQARVDARYQAKKLSHDESLRLFSWHAFRKPFPLDNYMDLSNGIVSYAGGVPLALEVLGSSLVGRTLAQWQSALDKLRVIPDKNIQDKLRISFDALDDDDVKNIFLDIACFFNGMQRTYVIDVLKGCGFFPVVGISILIDKCLLTITESLTLRMHDLLRDMGKHIVREKFPNEPGKHSRLWLHKEVHQVLTEHKGTNQIEGIIVDPPMQMHVTTQAFARMQKLRLLQINNVQLSGSFEGLFEELRWFCWHHCPLESLPIDFHPEKLAFLDLQDNNINVLWQGIKFLTNLKTLDLSRSKFLTATPDFSGTPELEKLHIASCDNLLEVHSSIGSLGRLTDLFMAGCNNLKSLPTSICNATSLEHLNLKDCKKLERLPEDLGRLECLKLLHVGGTAIKKLPASVGILSKLNELNLGFCRSLKTLPSSICNLKSLEELFLARSGLEQLPVQLGNMECLRELDASGTALKVIPDSIGLMNKLTKLSLNECVGNLKTESRFPFLQFLKASPSLSATNFLPSSVSSLSSLSELDLSNCSLSDEDIPDDLHGLSLLRALDLRKNMFCILPNSLGQLSNLKRLYLDQCCRLRSILQLPSNLRYLNASDCISLESIPDLSNMKFLKSLNFEECCKLVNIQGLHNLNSVKEIYLEGCSNLLISFEISLFQGDSGRFVNCSIHLPRREIPHWFNHQRLGTSVSFDAMDDSEKMIIWIDYIQEGKQATWKGPSMDNIGAVVNNITRGAKWSHYGYPSRTSKSEVKTWVNHGPLPYPIKAGDRIEVSIETYGDLKVEKYGIHLVYEPVVKATECSSLAITEVDGDEFMDGTKLQRGHDVGALETCSNETRFSKRFKLESREP